MNAILILPIVIPMAAAAVMLLAWQRVILQRRIAVLAAANLPIVGIGLLNQVRQQGYLVMQVGNWPAPYGITLVADLFSAIMVVLTGLVGLAVVVYSLTSIDLPRQTLGFYPLVLILLMGVNGAFLTGDLFNLYVWFEVMLIASFVLLSLGGERAQLLGAVHYVTLNLLSSAIFLAAVGLLYGTVGSLNFADLSVRLAQVNNPGLLNALAMLFLVAFGIKAAIFPLFFWLPAAYHTPPVVITALFSGLLTKVGVYALVRVFTLLFRQDLAYTQAILLTLAAFTMVIGVFGAVAQYDFRRLLSFHIISQIGYLLMGLGLFSIEALASVIFFMAHVILAKATLFLISGITRRRYGTYDLKQLGGAYNRTPGLAFLFLIPALSLAGIPPLSGFFAKLALIQAGAAAHQLWMVAVAVFVSFFTLFSMIKIWNEAFWKPQPENSFTPDPQPLPLTLTLPVVGLAAVTVALGLAAGPFFQLCLNAAQQLADPSLYVRAVLGAL